MKEDFAILADRYIESVIGADNLIELAYGPKRLTVKYGVDVTAPHLHLGHAVNLWLMRYLQEIGHKIVLLIGDFTTTIGDPTGKNKTRPVIPASQIEENAKSLVEQAGIVLLTDADHFEVQYNSAWYKKMRIEDLLRLLMTVTHSRLLSRDMFRERTLNNIEIYMHELIYPIFQAFDSVMLDSDLTIIGSDQLFNESLARDFQFEHGQSAQVIVTTKITPGIDGKEKQSKSRGNYVALGHPPREKFARIMKIPDALIYQYWSVYTDADSEALSRIRDISAESPLEAKLSLAEAVVARYHGPEIAREERQWFSDTFQRRVIPSDIPAVCVPLGQINMLELMKYIYPQHSNSENRRLIKQGAAKISGVVRSDPTEMLSIDKGSVVQVGKHTWYRLELNEDA